MWIEGDYVCMYDNEGRISGHFGIQRDVTARKQMEIERQAALEKFKALIDNLQMGVLVESHQRAIIHSNQAFCDLFGLPSPQAILGADCEAAALGASVLFQDPPRFVERVRNIMAAGKVVVNEELHLNDGRVFARDYVPVSSRGEYIGNMWLYRDITERKQAEEKLRQFSRAVEYSPATIVITDTQGNIQYVNPKFTQTTGYTAEEAIGNNPRILKSGITPPEEYKKLWMTITSGGEWRGEFCNRKKNGELYWESASISPILNERGETTHFVAIKEDITERKRAEESLRESEEQFRATFDQAAVGIAHVAPDGHWFQVNQKLCDIVGYSREELFGKTFQDITHPDDLDADLAYVRQVLAGEIKTYSMEKRYFRKDGSIVWINLTVSLVRAADGEPKYFIAVVEDITERKQMEVARQESERRFREMLESVQLIAVSLDVKGNITFCNDFLLALIGWEREEILGKSWFDACLPPEVRLDVRKMFAESILQETMPVHYENEIITRAGERRLVVWNNTMLKDIQGKVVGTASIGEDITARKQAEEEIRSHTRQLAGLLDASQSLTESLDPATVLQKITEQAANILNLETTAIYLLENDVLYLGATTPPLPPQFPDSLRVATLADHPHVMEAVTTRLPLILRDTATAELTSVERAVCEARALRTILYVPLLAGKIVMGVLIFGITGEPGEFSKNDIELSCTLSNQAAMAVTNAKLYDNLARYVKELEEQIFARKQAEEKIQRQNMRLKVLREIDTAILAADSAEDIVGAALSHTRELIGCRRAAVALFDWGENEALMFGVRTMGESSIPQGARLPLAPFQDLIQTLSQNQPTIIGDLTVLPDPPPLFQNLIRDGLRSMCILPLFSQSSLIGSFNMSSEIPGFFDEEKINLGCEVANQVAIAITQSRLVESLRASEEKYSIIFDKSPFAIILRKMPGNTIVGVNDAFLELFGFTRADVIGKTSLELGITGAESPAKAMAEFQARGSLHGFEVVRSTKTGRRLDLALNWDWVTIGGEKYILNTIQDITEQKLRGRERETLLALATALRAASNRAEMLPIILDQIISLLNLDGAALASLDSASGEAIMELARGGLEAWSNLRIPPGQGITGIVMASGETYFTDNLASDPNIYRPDLTGGVLSAACAPLIADRQTVGVLWITSQSRMQDADVRLLEGIANMAATALQRTTLFEQTVQYASQLSDAYEKNIEGWSRALDLRDKETEGHTLRVTALTLELARAMGIPEADIVHIRRGALLHDIGKMGVSDHILLKPGALTAEEMETMRQHPVFAYELLKPIEFLRDSLDIPWCHHEKWDGTGYPRGLKGEEIPLAARLFAVVDVWDALTSDRPYRQAWSKEKALDYLRQQAGRHFAPHVVELFLKLLKEDAQDAG
jgi:PAS domain S-box-containing protein/putative nucleotidyltransferase with HDIG domain